MARDRLTSLCHQLVRVLRIAGGGSRCHGGRIKTHSLEMETRYDGESLTQKELRGWAVVGACDVSIVKYGTMLMDLLHAREDENHNCIFFCRAVRRSVRAAGLTMCEEGAAAGVGGGVGRLPEGAREGTLPI